MSCLGLAQRHESVSHSKSIQHHHFARQYVEQISSASVDIVAHSPARPIRPIWSINLNAHLQVACRDRQEGLRPKLVSDRTATRSLAEGRLSGSADKHWCIRSAISWGHSSGTFTCTTCAAAPSGTSLVHCGHHGSSIKSLTNRCRLGYTITRVCISPTEKACAMRA